MSVKINKNPNNILTLEELNKWNGIPTTVISDAMDRTNGMDGNIKAIAPPMPFVGQALTVDPLERSNTALHYALEAAWPTCVMVVNAHANMASAVWGGVSIQAAKSRGIAAIVIDGCARDINMLLASGVPIYCRGIAPNGPNWDIGGAVNGPITCGGIDVAPGDIIIGDDDGVVVLPPSRMEGLMEKCQERVGERAKFLQRITSGTDSYQAWDLPAPEKTN
ncbi:MAG: RraA family protein [Rhodospirillales bacterium]|jgi:4-hydroxy-4-methyl-2-oxoglutarate aldolase